MSYSLSLDRFVGKVAVVTGASSGIGKAIAEGLVKYGVIVAGIARRLDRLNKHASEQIKERGKLYPFKCDLTKQEEIMSTFKKITEELGPIHILVNSAGISINNDLIDGDIEKWKPVIDVNVLAVAICTREAIKSMKAFNISGHIINVNAILGHRLVDIPRMGMYPASKFAVTGMTETTRLEINRQNLPIKITSLSPGYVKTEFVEVSGFKDVIDPNRPGLTAEDVADAAFSVLATPKHVNICEVILSVQGRGE